MQFPFTVMEQGLEFTFERVSCLEIWDHSGSVNNPTKYQRTKCGGRWRWMGRDSLLKAKSLRVGVCRKHCANEFTENTLQEWRDSDFTKAHIANIFERHRQLADQEAIREELGLPKWVHYGGPADRVMYDTYSQSYWVSVKGLTREDAIRIYKMADSIRAEREG